MPLPAAVSSADRAFAQALAERESVPRVVLDTNVWIDVLVFDDPAVRGLRAALTSGRLQALMAPRCRDELAIVLTYPQFAARDVDVGAALAWADAHTAPIAASTEDVDAAPLPLCSDRDDQKFLEAARDGGADWLVSKDRAVLKLRSRVARGFAFRIVTAAVFSALLEAAIGEDGGRMSGKPLRPARQAAQPDKLISENELRHAMNAPHNPAAPLAAPSLPSRLPNVGTTIFTVMSALAAEKQAVNLGQGFPDFACDPRIVDAVTKAMQDGHNQYPPMAGVPALRQAIAGKIGRLYGQAYDWDTEITVTAGATQALLTTILACVHPGDEVIVFEPTYDSYVPSIELAGGKPVFITLDAPEFRIPFDKLAAAITPRTRLILFNTPHNPSGTVWHASDLAKLADIVRGTDILLLSDEVYEHMVYDGKPHESVARHPELARRSFIVSSFGKTYHVTGWKVGFVAAPAALTAEFRKVHQFNVFTVNTPMQVGLAEYMRDPAPYLELSAFYQKKRDLFREGLANSRFKLLPCEGTYFQCVDYSAISTQSEADFALWLTGEIGVAAIPVSAFYHAPHESGVVRFCFAKKDDTLREALARLAKL